MSEIVQEDGSTLPPGYVPGDYEEVPIENTPPPDGQSWEDVVTVNPDEDM